MAQQVWICWQIARSDTLFINCIWFIRYSRTADVGTKTTQKKPSLWSMAKLVIITNSQFRNQTAALFNGKSRSLPQNLLKFTWSTCLARVHPINCCWLRFYRNWCMLLQPRAMWCCVCAAGSNKRVHCIFGTVSWKAAIPLEHLHRRRWKKQITTKVTKRVDWLEIIDFRFVY